MLPGRLTENSLMVSSPFQYQLESSIVEMKMPQFREESGCALFSNDWLKLVPLIRLYCSSDADCVERKQVQVKNGSIVKLRTFLHNLFPMLLLKHLIFSGDIPELTRFFFSFFFFFFLQLKERVVSHIGSGAFRS